MVRGKWKRTEFSLASTQGAVHTCLDTRGRSTQGAVLTCLDTRGRSTQGAVHTCLDTRGRGKRIEQNTSTYTGRDALTV